MSEVTQILEQVEQGDSKAADQLLSLVYEELCRLAIAKEGIADIGSSTRAGTPPGSDQNSAVCVAKGQCSTATRNLGL